MNLANLANLDKILEGNKILILNFEIIKGFLILTEFGRLASLIRQEN